MYSMGEISPEARRKLVRNEGEIGTDYIRGPCQGVTPSNFKGGLPAPEARAYAEEGGIRDEIDPSPSRSKARKTKQNTQSS